MAGKQKSNGDFRSFEREGDTPVELRDIETQPLKAPAVELTEQEVIDERNDDVQTVHGQPLTGENTRPPASHANPDGRLPNDLVHDNQGNVRPVFSGEGIGPVTKEDAEAVLQRIREQGKYVIVGRASEGEYVYDVYRANQLIIAGAFLADLRQLL